MVKKRVGGAHRYKTVQKAAGDAAGAGQHKQQKQQQDSGPKPPSHLQRKITKSVKFYEKVLGSAAPKAPQGVTKKKKKPAKTLVANLDSLAAEIDHITTAAGGSSSSPSQQQATLIAKGKGTKSSIKRSKARLAVTVTESSRLQKVLQHPAYKSDPVQAVMHHLMNTLPAAPQQQQQQRSKAGGGAAQQQKKRKKKKQQQDGGGVADMQD